MLSLISVMSACKDKEEPAPVAGFDLSSSVVNEGEVLHLLNRSTNAAQSRWNIYALGWKSTETSPDITFDTSGTFTIDLEVQNGEGKKSVATAQVQVVPDTIWRLSNNFKKLWRVQSIVYNGAEQIDSACEQDDDFTIWNSISRDTFHYTHGKDTCAAGTYLFEMPAAGDWRFNSSKKTLEFALTVLGSPFTLSFVTSYCTKDAYIGKDNTNNVILKLVKK